MLNIDSDFDGEGHSNATCKQTINCEQIVPLEETYLSSFEI